MRFGPGLPQRYPHLRPENVSKRVKRHLLIQFCSLHGGSTGNSAPWDETQPSARVHTWLGAGESGWKFSLEDGRETSAASKLAFMY